MIITIILVGCLPAGEDGSASAEVAKKNPEFINQVSQRRMSPGIERSDQFSYERGRIGL
jgi:hypothetical protein